MPVELVQLAVRIGRLMKFWGFKEVHGRIWTLVYLSETALTSPDIMSTLSLSKSATNMALSDLKQFNLIEFAGIDDTRHQRYKTNLNFEQVLSKMFSVRFESLADELKSSLKALESVATRQPGSISRKRLKELAQSTSAIGELKKYPRV